MEKQKRDGELNPDVMNWFKLTLITTSIAVILLVLFFCGLLMDYECCGSGSYITYHENYMAIGVFLMKSLPYLFFISPALFSRIAVYRFRRQSKLFQLLFASILNATTLYGILHIAVTLMDLSRMP